MHDWPFDDIMSIILTFFLCYPVFPQVSKLYEKDAHEPHERATTSISSEPIYKDNNLPSQLPPTLLTREKFS